MSGPQPISELMFGRAVDSLMIGSVFAVAVWLILRLESRFGSARRFAICFSALLATAAVFLCGGISRSATAGAHTAIAISSRWAVYGLGAWVVGASVAILRLAAGLWRLRRLRHGCTPIESEFMINSGLHGATGWRRISICVSEGVRVPTAIGFFRPVVLLPTWTLHELSHDELNAVVLHEIAHLERWDDWTNLVQKLLRALLFFHPAVWWIDRQLTAEREIACDDAVLAKATNPRHYAQCLVSLAEKSFLRRPLLLAQAAVGRVKLTAERVTRILDGRERRLQSVWRPATAALTAFLFAGFLVARHAPRLITFTQDSAPVSSSAAPEISHAIAVPASLHFEQTENAKRTRRAVRRQDKDEVVPARVRREPAPEIAARETAFPPRAPMVVNARAVANAQPRVVFVIFQTREYDGSGGMVVTTSVWQFRVATPARAQSAAVRNSRST